MRLPWYLKLCDAPQLSEAKFYDFAQRIRVEMIPIGHDPASNHSILDYSIYLSAGLKQIPLKGKDNCSYRKAGIGEAQPDLSFYLGENVNVVSDGAAMINLDN